jgi:hypothetical protein
MDMHDLPRTPGQPEDAGPPPGLPGAPRPESSPLDVFVACAHQMLDPATPEAVRRATEPRLLAQLPLLRALGVFELFEVRDAALRRLLEDEWGGPLAG